jgi:hypothetical protein
VLINITVLRTWGMGADLSTDITVLRTWGLGADLSTYITVLRTFAWCALEKTPCVLPGLKNRTQTLKFKPNDLIAR